MSGGMRKLNVADGWNQYLGDVADKENLGKFELQKSRLPELATKNLLMPIGTITKLAKTRLSTICRRLEPSWPLSAPEWFKRRRCVSSLSSPYYSRRRAE